MKKFLTTILVSLALAASASADLIISFNSHIISSDDSTFSVGEAITSTYFLPGTPEDLFGDGSSLAWDNASVSLTSGGTTVFESSYSLATLSSLGGVSGFQSLSFSDTAFVAEALSSNSPSVLTGGILTPNLPIGDFDYDASGYLISDVGVTSWTIDSYRVSAVPEPSTYGMIGAGILLGVALLRRRARQAA